MLPVVPSYYLTMVEVCLFEECKKSYMESVFQLLMEKQHCIFIKNNWLKLFNDVTVFLWSGAPTGQ